MRPRLACQSLRLPLERVQMQGQLLLPRRRQWRQRPVDLQLRRSPCLLARSVLFLGCNHLGSAQCDLQPCSEAAGLLPLLQLSERVVLASSRCLSHCCERMEGPSYSRRSSGSAPLRESSLLLILSYASCLRAEPPPPGVQHAPRPKQLPKPHEPPRTQEHRKLAWTEADGTAHEWAGSLVHSKCLSQ